jgi:hypothetical protein
MSIGAGRVLMLHARPVSQQSRVCAPFVASTATAHEAPSVSIRSARMTGVQPGPVRLE